MPRCDGFWAAISEGDGHWRGGRREDLGRLMDAQMGFLSIL